MNTLLMGVALLGLAGLRLKNTACATLILAKEWGSTPTSTFKVSAGPTSDITPRPVQGAVCRHNLCGTTAVTWQ